MLTKIRQLLPFGRSVDSLVGVGVAASAMTGTSAIAGVDTASSTEPEQKGYQLSQHVLDYYKSADV